MRFWLPWSIDALVASVVLVFLFWGLADGSVSSFNIVLWLGILAVVAAIVGGSLWLKSIGRPTLATILGLVLAVPGLLGALFFLLVIFSGQSWN